MKCLACNQRKGKRPCPAIRGNICTPCCGEKRVIEIDCPPDCEYLKAGQTHSLQKKYVSLMSHEHDSLKRDKYYRVTAEFGGWIEVVETAIVRYGRDLRALRDEEILEAIVSLGKTFETERKGVIFEHKSPNPIVQSLSRELYTLIEELRKKPPEELPRLRISDVINLFEVMKMNVQYHLDHEPAGDSYLEFVRKTHPEIHEEKPAGGLITLP